jgi:ureidoacrylate peracid hydrolase
MLDYPTSNTALVLVDPLNEFLSRRGMAWPIVGKVAKQVDLISNMQNLTESSRKAGWQIAFAPHHRHHKDSFSERKYLHPSQILQRILKGFRRGGFGSRYYPTLQPINGDIIASEHDCSSGFTGTDLHEKLQEKSITHVVLAGLLSNTCIESTARSALDLGYHVTLLTDAVAAWSEEDHRAAVDLNYPHLAHIMSTTDQLISIQQ